MLTRSNLTVATALAIATLAAPAATAMPAEPVAGNAKDLQSSPTRGEPRTDPRQANMYASTVTPPDARGEHAAALADDEPAASDLRTPDAVEPFTRPVVVEVGDPVSPGFDWTAGIIGLAAGLAFAVLAGIGVSGGRRRRSRPRTA